MLQTLMEDVKRMCGEYSNRFGKHASVATAATAAASIASSWWAPQIAAASGVLAIVFLATLALMGTRTKFSRSILSFADNAISQLVYRLALIILLVLLGILLFAFTKYSSECVLQLQVLFYILIVVASFMALRRQRGKWMILGLFSLVSVLRSFSNLEEYFNEDLKRLERREVYRIANQEIVAGIYPINDEMRPEEKHRQSRLRAHANLVSMQIYDLKNPCPQQPMGIIYRYFSPQNKAVMIIGNFVYEI